MGPRRQSTSPLRTSWWGILLLCAACAGPARVADVPADLPEGFPHHSVEQVIHQLERVVLDSLTSLVATADVSVRSPLFTGSITARIRQRRGDSLAVFVSDATLGIEGGRALATPDSFFYHDRLSRTLYVGSLAHAPEQLTGENVFRVLLGLLAPDRIRQWNVEADAAYYHVRDAEGERHYAIDPTVWRVVSYEERSPEGRLVQAVVFSDYGAMGSVLFPQRIVLRLPGMGTNVSLRYRRMAVNPARLSMALRVPEGVQRVPVREELWR